MKWHREPLIHFLALGVGLFLLHGAVAEPAPEASAIELSAGHVEQLVHGFQRTWQRPPSQAELDGLIEGRVREEVLYREALAMGLDRDDTIVRRRLRQKVEFLFEDMVALVKPTEADLAAYLEEHGEKFRPPRRFSFRHVYLSREQRGDAVLDDAERLLADLRRGAGVLGDPLQMVDDRYRSLPEAEAAKLFGPGFAQKLAEVPAGDWTGPVESGFGLHLVLLSERIEGEVPALDEVRDVVERDWLADRRARSAETYYEGLLERYTVRVERPEPAPIEVAEVQP